MFDRLLSELKERLMGIVCAFSKLPFVLFLFSRLKEDRSITCHTTISPGVLLYAFIILGFINKETGKDEERETINITAFTLFSETYWFYLLLFIVLCIITLVSIQIRNRNFKKREEELKKAVNDRTKELLDEKNKTDIQAKQLREANKLQSRLFDNISHELRSPLSLIITPLEALDSGNIKVNSRTWKQQVRLMLQNSRKLLNLSEQLLEISKIESGKISLKLELVSIHPFLKKIIQSYTEAFDEKSIQLELNSNIKNGKMFIDKGKFEMALGNLISNAIKFTPSNGKVHINLKEDPEEFVMEVKDSGVGISKELLPNIFDRFYKINNDNSPESEGFGIGLSIVKEFVELHSGTIQVESIPGIGSVFAITIPKKHVVFLNQEENESKIQAESFKQSPNTKKFFSLPVNLTLDKTTILVIDDNKDMRDFISSILSNDYKVIEATNGKEAYQKILESPPDLIISDIVMPEMNGRELNKLLKSNLNTAAIPFIFLTGKPEETNKIVAIKEGADVYLTKPFNTEELRGHVNNLISSRLRLRMQIIEDFKHPPSEQEKNNISDDSFLKQLYAIMEKEFSNPELSVHTVQEKLFMSRSSFYRTINEKTGLNTQQFINQYRLQKAREMLINEKGSISEIAYACGFNSLSYFSRSFKDSFGISPSEFLKSHPVSD